LAEGGKPQAQFNLALLYSNGLGVVRAPQIAQRWFLAAAEQGNVQAQYNLALMLQTGDGIESDIAAARGWYEKAARQGLAAAQNNLGLMYLEGQGMPRDLARALRWLARAAGESLEARNNLQGLAARLPVAQVTASLVNLRAGPSRQSQVLDQVGRDAEGLLLDRRGGWSRLWFSERETIGWIADRLLAVEDKSQTTSLVATDRTSPAPVDSPPPAEANDTVAEGTGEPEPPRDTKPADDGAATPGRWYRIATASADLRERPKREARTLERLGYGTAVEVLARERGWRQVRVVDSQNQKQGWLSAFSLTPDAEAEARAAAEAEARRAAAAVGAGGG
jgi:uncharacterized protein YgiM (DUF1202 family)